MWPNKCVLLFCFWGDAGKCFSSPGKPHMFNNRGENLEQRAQASLWLPGRWPSRFHAASCLRASGPRHPSRDAVLRGQGTKAPDPDLRWVVRGPVPLQAEVSAVQCRTEMGRGTTTTRSAESPEISSD